MKEDVKVCIPTYNEEKSISSVIRGVREEGHDAVVIDGESTDDTQQIAKQSGAKVIEQRTQGGKGSAMRDAFNIFDDKILVFIDGDGTYEPEHIGRITEPIIEDEYHHVIGNRFADMKEGSMSKSHILGNRFVDALFSVYYNNSIVDLLSGFRAVDSSIARKISLRSSGFEIETELTALCALNKDIRMTQVPTKYYERIGDSKLSGVMDGAKIFSTLVKCRFR